MTTAGQKLVAGAVPGERIATTIRTSNSSGVTTSETSIDTVTFAAVSGRTYRITYDASVKTTVAADRFYVRIREDSSSGTLLRYNQRYLHTNSAAWPVHVEAEWTASSTGSKTIVGTIQRAAGTGTGDIEADATNPSYLYVDYIRG